MAPSQLSKDYDHVRALFGKPTDNLIIRGDLYYAETNLCGGRTNEMWPADAIVMVDRGDCTFVEKVRQGQRGGATAVLIADNTCLCSDTECKSNGIPCQTSWPILADNGSGADIVIPSVLLRKSDTDRIKAVLVQETEVKVFLQWQLPPPDRNPVWLDVWTAPDDPLGTALMQDLVPALSYLSIDFEPHQYVYDGIRAHCQDEDGKSRCGDLCTNNGRYCSTSPDNGSKGGITGADVTKESLRRLCIWRVVGADQVGRAWWNYVVAFAASCNHSGAFTNDDCIQSVMDRAGVDTDAVSTCMSESGGLEGNVVNTLLGEEINDQAMNGVVIIPTVRVGSNGVDVTASADQVFLAIGARYSAESEPEVCRRCVACVDVMQCAHHPAFECSPGTTMVA